MTFSNWYDYNKQITPYTGISTLYVPPAEVKPPEKGVVGIVNIGQTCYLASIIQALARSRLLVNKIRDIDSDNIFIIRLKSILLYLNSECDGFDTKLFIQEFTYQFNEFVINQQHDSQEACNRLLDYTNIQLKGNFINLEFYDLGFLNDHYRGYMMQNHYPDIVIFDKLKQVLAIQKPPSEFLSIVHNIVNQINFIKREYSIVNELFQGLFLNFTKCPKCNNRTNNIEPFLFFPVNIPETVTQEFMIEKTLKPYCIPQIEFTDVETKMLDYFEKINDIYNNIAPALEGEFNDEFVQNENYSFDLIDCLNEFSKTEFLDDDNKLNCNKCSEKVNAQKNNYVLKLPKCLIINIKRFKQYYDVYRQEMVVNKKENLIEFPLRDLDLSPFLSPISNKNVKSKYNLYAVVNHSNIVGNRNITAVYGHYSTYAINYHDGKWYEYNDYSVFPRDEKDIVTPKAYMLFYILDE